ncbi:MAG: penicillin-binding protein 2 [Candidatus Dormibacteria bacterium]
MEPPADPRFNPSLAPRGVVQHRERDGASGRLLLFGAAAAMAGLGLVAGLFNLQVVQSKALERLAEGNRVRRESVLAPRGIVFDRHGVQLVTNQASFSVALVAADLPAPGPRRSQELQRLADLTGVSVGEVETELKREVDHFQPLVVKRGLSTAEYLAVNENLPSMPGVRLQQTAQRQYLTAPGLAQLLGYVGSVSPQEYAALRGRGYLIDDQVGKAGLEYAQERWLRGQAGIRVVETDAQGRVVRTISTADPRPGADVYLTLDLGLQREVGRDLQVAIDQARKTVGSQAKGGAAIVMNPKTGEVLSMVSLPDYDPNLFAKGITQQAYDALVKDPNNPLLNRAIGGQYPPGSTFKLVSGSAALQQGVVKPDTQINDPGYLRRGGTTFHGWYAPGFGLQNMVQALAHSDDIYFYTIAEQLGDLALGRYARDFGVGRATGIELGPEARGIAPDSNWKKAYFAQAYKETGDPAWLDSTWYPGDTITYGIGQSYLLVTPLQDLNWTVAVANGGNYLRPQLTGRVVAADGSLLQPFATKVNHRVGVSAENLAVIREGLRAAVNGPRGTASLLRNLPDAAAKTGTAEFGVADASGRLPTDAWFVSFAPASDPEVAVVVMVEGGGEGSTVAEPAAAKILSYYFANRAQINSQGR